ncbi:hypothetical protein H1R20_g12642, partial [Candolleomyces eurysporus]
MLSLPCAHGPGAGAGASPLRSLMPSTSSPITTIANAASSLSYDPNSAQWKDARSSHTLEFSQQR